MATRPASVIAVRDANVLWNHYQGVRTYLSILSIYVACLLNILLASSKDSWKTLEPIVENGWEKHNTAETFKEKKYNQESWKKILNSTFDF